VSGHFQQAVIALCTCTTNVLSAFVVGLPHSGGCWKSPNDDAGPADIRLVISPTFCFLKWLDAAVMRSIAASRS
jgi:hypothetical protein